MNILKVLLNVLPAKTVYAHCDIPCGLYDPSGAQMAAQTVLKMVTQIKELEVPKEGDQEAWLQYHNALTRRIMNKEKHAKLCEEELMTLWIDYFKPEHLEKFPDLHDTFWKTAKLCGKNMQNIDEAMAKELVSAVDKIADMFAQTKQ